MGNLSYGQSFRVRALRIGSHLAAIALIWSFSLAGQAPEASLFGVVNNDQSQPLAGATVTATEVDTGLVQTTTSDSEGRYYFGALPPGVYSLSTKMAAYQGLEKRGIELEVDAKHEENLTLNAVTSSGQATVNQIFRVIPPAPALTADTTASSVSVVIEDDKISLLPLASRNIYSLFLLQPGVTSQGAVGARGLTFSVHGQRVSGSNYQLDGTDNNNIVLTGPVVATSAEAIQEFRMVNSSFSAENGRATAFVAQVVTRAGSNRFHGSLFEFLSNDALDANTFQNDATGTAKSPFHQNQFGYSFGGPIEKNKTFFWSGVELSRLEFGAPLDLLVPSSSFIDSLPADSIAKELLTEIPPYPSTPTAANPDIGEAKFQAPNQINTFLTTQRLDHNFANEKDRLTFRYTLSATNEQLNEGVGSAGTGAAAGSSGIGYPSLIPTDRFRGQNSMAGWTHSFNGSRTNELTIGWSREGIDLPRPRSDVAILQSLDGVLLPSSPRQSGQQEDNNVIQISDRFSEQRGRSELTMGFEFRRDLSNSLTLGLQNEAFGGSALIPQGLYTFDSLASFGLGQPLAFAIGVSPLSSGQLQLPNLARKYRSNEYAAFAQEDVKLTSRFSVNAGLRYEYYGVLHSTDPSQDLNFYFGPGSTIEQQLANGVVRNTDQNPGALKDSLYRPTGLNLAPSIGVAWDPFGNGRSVVRAGYALAFDRVLDTVRDLRSNSLQVTNCLAFAGCTPINLVVPTANAVPLLNQNSVLPSPYDVVQLDEHLRTPYAENWYFGLQQTVTPNFLIEIGHSGSIGRQLLTRDVINRSVDGAPPLNSQIGQDTFISNGGNSSYLALEVGLRRRFSKGLQYQVSYTWSHAIDDQSDIFEGISTDPRTGAFALATLTQQFNEQLDKGNANFDQRHNLVVNATWELPKLPGSVRWVNGLFRYWTVSAIGAQRSGFPVTVIGNSISADPTTGLLNNRLDFLGAPGQPYNSPNPTPVPGGVQWLDPNLFQPAVGHVGNTGRGAIQGPGFGNYDLALSRDISLAETKRMQFRIEFYNVFNHPNLSPPVTTYLSNPFTGALNPDFGKAYYGLNATPSRFGDLPLESPARRIQFGLRIEF